MPYKLFLFVCVLLPFQVALNPAEGIDLASIRVLILLIFFLCLSEGLKKKNIRIPFNIQNGLIFSFLFFNALSFFVARNNDWSLRKLLFLFSVFPIYFAGVYLINNREKLISIAKAIVLGGTLAAVLGIGQFFFQFIFGLEKVYKIWADHVIVPFLGKNFSEAVLQNPSWLVNISRETYLRATATFPDPHMFSFFLGIVIAFALVLLLTEKRKVLYGLALSVLLVADGLTFSRSGYLGIVAGAIFLVVFFWKKMRLRGKVLFLSVCFLAGLFLATPNPVSVRYVSIFNLKEGSNKGRLEIWERTSEIIKEKPLLGVGIGNYPLEIKPTAAYREPFYAHNTYLDIAAETGVLNAFIWLGVLFFFWRSFKQKAQKDRLFLGLAFGVVVFAVQSLAETALYSPIILALFLILLSLDNIKENEYKCN